jgi:hypothetical protein
MAARGPRAVDPASTHRPRSETATLGPAPIAPLAATACAVTASIRVVRVQPGHPGKPPARQTSEGPARADPRSPGADRGARTPSPCSRSPARRSGHRDPRRARLHCHRHRRVHPRSQSRQRAVTARARRSPVHRAIGAFARPCSAPTCPRSCSSDWSPARSASCEGVYAARDDAARTDQWHVYGVRPSLGR